jgi:hypothetical protein
MERRGFLGRLFMAPVAAPVVAKVVNEGVTFTVHESFAVVDSGWVTRPLSVSNAHFMGAYVTCSIARTSNVR